MFRRFAVFAFNSHAPSGGWDDLALCARTLDEAEEEVMKVVRWTDLRSIQIVDLLRGKVVSKGFGLLCNDDFYVRFVRM